MSDNFDSMAHEMLPRARDAVLACERDEWDGRHHTKIMKATSRGDRDELSFLMHDGSTIRLSVEA